MTPDIQKLRTVWKQFSEARAIVEVRATYVAEEAESNARAELETLLFENDALPAILDRLEGLEKALAEIGATLGTHPMEGHHARHNLDAVLDTARLSGRFDITCNTTIDRVMDQIADVEKVLDRALLATANPLSQEGGDGR